MEVLYEVRAVAAILLFTELDDESSPAEDCVDAREFEERRERARASLKAHLEQHASMAAPDRWVRRAFLSNPPRRGHLDGEWKEPLVEWVLALGLSREARRDLEDAVRSLFSDGLAAWSDLARRRPALTATARRLLRLDDVRRPALDLKVTEALSDSIVPAYVTCPDVHHIIWTNRAMQALFGQTADRFRRMTVQDLVDLTAALANEADRDRFVSRQEAVLEAGRMVGRGHMEVVIDLERRDWLRGVDTPPFRGRLHLTAQAHVILDDQDERVGSLVLVGVRPAD